MWFWRRFRFHILFTLPSFPLCCLFPALCFFIFINSDSSLVFYVTTAVASLRRSPCCQRCTFFFFIIQQKKKDRFKQRGSGLGAPCPSLRLKIDSSSPLPTTLPTLLAAWSWGRASRVVWLKEAACMRDQVAEPSISLFATVDLCVCYRVWWTGDNTNVGGSDNGISGYHGVYYCRAVNYKSSGFVRCVHFGRFYQW